MSKTKVLYFLLVIGTLILFFLVKAYHVLMLLVMLLVLPIFFRISLFYCKKNITSDGGGDGLVYEKNEGIPIVLTLQNRGYLRAAKVQIFINYHNQFNASAYKRVLITALPAKKTKTVTFKLSSKFCGLLKVDIEAIKIQDAFELFEIKKAINKIIELNVLPGIKSTDKEGFEEDSGVEEPFGIREYREGDRQRQIHWKLSLKQDKWMVREYTLANKEKWLLFVDFCLSNQDNKLKAIDQLLEEVSGVSDFLLSQATYHTIAWYDGTQETFEKLLIKNAADLLQAQQYLIAARPYEGEPRGLVFYKAQEMKFALVHYFVAGRTL